MKRETVKTLILTVLVAVSIYFTFNIWTFQPSFDPIKNLEYLEQQPLSAGERVMGDVIKPQQLFYHEKGKHYNADSEASEIWTGMADWKLEQSKDVTEKFGNEKLKDFVYGKDGQSKVDLVFSQSLPAETFQSILDWETPPSRDQTYDRIIIPLDRVRTPRVYFVSTGDKKVTEVKLKTDVAIQLRGEFFTELDAYPQYFAWEVRKDTTLLLPMNKVSYPKTSYSFQNFSGEKFKNALFSNPSYVTSSVTEDSQLYTDLSNIMRIRTEQTQMEFTSARGSNPNAKASSLATVLSQSKDYLNAHGGWTDDYVFFSHDENMNVTLKIMKNNLPVFASEDIPQIMAGISLQWAGTEVNRYEHPTFQLRNDSNPVNILLEDGYELKQMISGSTGQLSVNNIIRVFPAYELSKSSEDLNMIAEPAWYAETKSGTYHLINDPVTIGGGNRNGLE
ncbi:hypothetical protein GKZ89_11995 [Bacillus mangrovi]|uniref:Regulatory protein YycH domain-containing protein n=1 Tax=Metabacillus mangrovi TaxID=1491830 RepID=A0A7X2S5N5_9BACI|nr:two-component system activity regulator YycH [Metabacillus mangrovi]MTH54129.1 hypothetical protein [Metabacillus mangrovi]